MIRLGIIAHGGACSSEKYSYVCKNACKKAFKLLKKNALDAVTEAARILEDDGRFNAGSGSSLRLDGKTIQMDASLMDSEGNLGIVIGIEGIKNPVLVARSVMKTPHVILSGDGATNLALKKGFERLKGPSRHAINRFNRVKNALIKNNYDTWDINMIRSNWNFAVSYKSIFRSDTIGAVAIDAEGLLAVANSTGGASPMLNGRVGDSPIIGCGFFAGKAASVATTGIGEYIIKSMLAKFVYDLIAQGEDIQLACDKGVKSLPHDIPTGVIAISRRGYGVACNRPMAHGVMILED